MYSLSKPGTCRKRIKEIENGGDSGSECGIKLEQYVPDRGGVYFQISVYLHGRGVELSQLVRSYRDVLSLLPLCTPCRTLPAGEML